MTQYTQLRNKLNTMFPELLELKFGCEVEIQEKDTWTVTVAKVIDDKCFKCSDGIFYERCKYVILGTPPELRHVLMAFNLGSYIKIHCSGLLEIAGKTNTRYNLTLPLHEQDEDTLLKLNEIIK